MKRNLVYMTCLFLLYSFTGCSNGDDIPDLKETYGFKDDRPFGGSVAYKILQNSFPENYVQVMREPFSKSYPVFSDTSSLYFCISRNLFVSDHDVSAILDYVSEGNTALFASAYFDSVMLNKLFCTVSKDMRFNNSAMAMQKTTVKLIRGIHSSADTFQYYYLPFNSFFTSAGDHNCRIVGYNSFGNPNCIVFFWGKGKLFLHADPRAFSNYFLLTRNNYRYMQELLQVTVTEPAHVYWDDHYNKINRPETSRRGLSSLSEVMRYPGLRAAFWLLLLSIALFVIFGIKRKQRIIEQLKQNTNSSVAFTETIARLYLLNHDHKDIANKMISYFYDFIRNKYFLHVQPGNSEFISLLSRKSGVAEEKTAALFQIIAGISENKVIDDQHLLTLSREIQQFLKPRK